ncbi:cytochrome C oxidase subunit II [Virgibacillus sp. MSP4-1]|uniref:hypothetical protein n=1 Tax=Virgibacillus sp. MSP4-1 TaxID=2700081 RepID=UPI0003A9B511|nr:hypothetical protein [Virgibacillus sp. MSP4-1]QHS21714.1 cytochrome C oxidase subunit II [Virgibacillus sp. MSP4-1]
MLQEAALFISVMLMLFVGIIFLVVYRWSTLKKEDEYQRIQKKWYRARSIYFSLLLITIIVLSFITLKDLPYDKPDTEAAEFESVDVNSVQFGWEISKDEFTVGDSVAFHVTASDVTHGFGLYNEDMMLVAQTQAMPEYTNTVYYTFDEPGTYEILCLEYCGVGHHVMTKEITVKEAGGGGSE